MRLRAELFVDDVEASVSFYTEALGFAVVRRSPDYVSIRRGQVVLGLGPVAKLRADGPGLTAPPAAADKGAGVEIVLELDDLEELTAAHQACRAHTDRVEELQQRPWGLWDFRVHDPDGYYLRLTHGDATAEG